MGTHYYDKGEYKLPSVTTIISDCNDKSAALTNWAARMVCDWIRENCEDMDPKFGPNYGYQVTEVELESAAKNFREVSNKALEIGSQTHAAIEEWLQTGKEPQDLSQRLQTLSWHFWSSLTPII